MAATGGEQMPTLGQAESHRHRCPDGDTCHLAAAGVDPGRQVNGDNRDRTTVHGVDDRHLVCTRNALEAGAKERVDDDITATQGGARRVNVDWERYRLAPCLFNAPQQTVSLTNDVGARHAKENVDSDTRLEEPAGDDEAIATIVPFAAYNSHPKPLQTMEALNQRLYDTRSGTLHEFCTADPTVLDGMTIDRRHFGPGNQPGEPARLIGT
jgi:hypothetical protein